MNQRREEFEDSETITFLPRYSLIHEFGCFSNELYP